MEGKSSFTGLTDPNHNVKNGQYQMVIGGNTCKTIGHAIIDAGLLPIGKVPQDLWRIKDFASDLLVLKLASAKTIESVLPITVMDELSKKATCMILFFMRTHLYAVNNDGKLHAKTRCYLLWCSLIFMLQIDGVHHTTKKNWLVATVSLTFTMLRSDV